MTLIATSDNFQTEYAIIDFENRTWFCPKDNAHTWISFESLCAAISIGTFVADRTVCDDDPYMDEFTSIEDYIAKVNADPDCLNFEVCRHFNSLSDLKSFIELDI